MNISRDKAIEHLKKYINNEKLLQHCYSSEAVMIALAKKFNEDENKWWNEILSFELKPLLEEIWFDDSAKVTEILKQLSR